MESMSTGPAAIAGRVVQRVQRAWRRWPLPAQLLAIGVAVACAAAGTAWVLSMPAAAVAAATLAALACAMACALGSQQGRLAAGPCPPPSPHHEDDAQAMTEHDAIVCDLHDTVSQSLFAANLMAGVLARAAEGSQRTRAQALERLNRGALAEWQMLMLELRPGALQCMPLHDLLQQAIDALAGRGDIEVTMDVALAEDGLAPAQRLLVYRIAQHALAHIGRHSGASRAQLEWSVQRCGQARLRIADNGPVVDPGRPHRSLFGLDHLRSRAAEQGFVMTQRSTAGTGAELVLELATARALA